MGIDAEQIVVPQAPAPAPSQEYPPAPAYAPEAVSTAPAYAPGYPAYAPAVAVKKPRPMWILPAAIAAVGLIASGTLGYLVYSTGNKLDSTRHQLTTAQLALDGANKDLAAQHAQAAYVSMYDQDFGRLSTDFGLLTECDSSSACKLAAQTMLDDTQAFQEDRQAAKVPGALASVDGMLGDGLSAEVSALQQLIAAINGGDMNKIQAAFTDVNDATLVVFKTEAQLGKLVQ
jgi:hypothetical protein